MARIKPLAEAIEIPLGAAIGLNETPDLTGIRAKTCPSQHVNDGRIADQII